MDQPASPDRDDRVEMQVSPSDAVAPIVISVGTRPEIIKMAPRYAELRRRELPLA